MNTPYGDDGVDDSAYNDVCHHGVGFDEECEWCELEDGLDICEDGHEYDVLDGRCHHCGAYAPAKTDQSHA